MNMPCPACQTLVEIGIQYTGRKLLCPECSQKFLLPDSDGELWGIAEDTERETWQNKLAAQAPPASQPQAQEVPRARWGAAVANAFFLGIALSSLVVGIIYLVRMITP